MYQINRRDFIRMAGMVLTVPTMASLATEKADKKKPNLLIIQTDQHNFRTLGCYRETLSPEQAFMWGENAVVETPNIDWIAHNGAICTKYYATSPVCSPSRASFVSGQYTQNTLVITNHAAMSNDVITFADILGRAGYATGYAGKWHLNGEEKPQWAPARKFGFKDNRYMFNRGHWKQLEGTPQGPRVKARKGKQGKKPSTDIKGADEKSFTTDWLADKTIDFISSNKKNPFCYMVSIPDPHGPKTVRAPYDSMYNSMVFRKPHTYTMPPDETPDWAMPENFSHSQSQYFGMVKCIDDNVGKILKHLRETRLIDNTIVVFTSDHGDMLGEHDRRYKGSPFEASAKIPFVIYYPEKIKAGRTVPQALGTVDFLPTILGLMEVSTAGKEEGRDASSLFTGGNPPADWKDVTFLRRAQTNGLKWLAAFTGRYKLVVSPGNPPWLTDMQQDPDELKNFCFDPEYREIVRTLAKEIIDYGKRFNDTGTSIAKIAEDLQQLANGIQQYPDNTMPDNQKSSVI